METARLTVDEIADIVECYRGVNRAYNALGLDFCYGTFYRAMGGNAVGDAYIAQIRELHAAARGSVASTKRDTPTPEQRRNWRQK